MAKLKVIRCVIVFIFLFFLKIFLSNIGPLDVKIDPRIALPESLRFIPPVVLSILILLSIVDWIKYQRQNHTIAKFLTVEFLVVLFSSVLLPAPLDLCRVQNPLTDWPNCVTVNLAAQLILFASIITQMSHSRYLKAFSYLILFVAIIVLLLYEKTTSVILSSVFVILLTSNRFVTKISNFFIQESPYFERIHDISVSKHVISSI